VGGGWEILPSFKITIEFFIYELDLFFSLYLPGMGECGLGEFRVGGSWRPPELSGAGRGVTGEGPSENDRGGAAFFREDGGG